MKANELMIDDWVYNKNIDEPIQVYPVMFSQMFRSNPNATTEDYNIFPVPLTTEILEKNGFKKTQIHGEKQDDIFQCFDGEIIIEVGIYDPNFILINYHYETPDGINSGELSSIVKVDGGKFYLHELQHALRLCGIEKEIKL